jgi:hypothetical protein
VVHVSGATRLDSMRFLFTLSDAYSSDIQTGRHDIAEILLKVALKHHKSKKKNQYNRSRHFHIIVETHLLFVHISVRTYTHTKYVITHPNDLFILLFYKR